MVRNLRWALSMLIGRSCCACSCDAVRTRVRRVRNWLASRFLSAPHQISHHPALRAWLRTSEPRFW